MKKKFSKVICVIILVAALVLIANSAFVIRETSMDWSVSLGGLSG